MMTRRFLILFISVLALAEAACGQAPAPPVNPTSPEQVRLSWSEDPRTTTTVVWQTAVPTATSTVEYGPTEALGKTVTGRRPTYAQQTGILHEATIRGLKPGSITFYRAGDAQGGFSPIRQFRTAPGQVEDFTFTAFGDQGVSENARKNVDLVLKNRPAFHLVLGDLSYANGNQPVWDQWFRQNEPMTAVLPMMTTLGNHENERIGTERIGYVSYLARLAMPSPETWYLFDYAGVRFVAFNTDDHKNAEQLRWLDETLEAAKKDPKVRYVVLFTHHPLYSSNVNRLDNASLIETLRKRLDDGGVDLVLAGHNHNYERSYPLRGAEATNRDRAKYRQGEGVIFVVAGGGGKSLYQFVPEMPAKTAVRESVPHTLFVRVPAKGPMVVEAIRTSDGGVMDRFEIAPRRMGSGPAHAKTPGREGNRDEGRAGDGVAG